MKLILSEENYKLCALFFTAIMTVLFGKKFSFNNFTVFQECYIHAVAGWHKAQVDESCLWVSYDLDTTWKSEDFQNACASCSCHITESIYLNASQNYIILEAIPMESLLP